MGGSGSNMSGGNTQGFMGNERRIVLVGKTGVGKSAAGNTILGWAEFKSALSPTSTTAECQKAEGSVDSRQVAVIDTPGLFDTKFHMEEVLREIKRCICLSSPGPHAFLVVMQLGRFTQEEKDTVQIIQDTFGEDAAKYTMVLFTHGDQLKNQTIEGFVSKSPDLVALVQSCSGRYHVFNNDVEDLEQPSQLLEKIDMMMTANDGSYYSNDMFVRAETAIKRKMERLLKEREGEKQRELKELRKKYSGEDYRRKEAEVNRRYEEQARSRAERSNTFITSITAIYGAAIGAAVGALGGPLGVAAGGVAGAAGGAAVGKKVWEHCTTQ